MAYVGLRDSYQWHNKDTLLVTYGVGEAQVTRVGEYSDPSKGNLHTTEIRVALASLPTVASGNVQILSDSVTIPNGAFIEDVEVIVVKETAGTNANFNLGLVDQDRTTELDNDGLLAAADAFNGGTDLGGVYRYARVDGTLTTEGGVLIGTKLTNTGLLVAFADTADFTAGVLQIKVNWWMPLTADP